MSDLQPRIEKDEYKDYVNPLREVKMEMVNGILSEVVNGKVFYQLSEIEKLEAYYNIIFGGRSDGKTHSILKKMIVLWVNEGRAGAYVRRLESEVVKSLCDEVFAGLIALDEIAEITNGEWTSVMYESRKFYLSRYDEALQKWVKQSKPFCYIFTLSTAMSRKGPTYPNIDFILFDEFISSDGYLHNEPKRLKNLISTIVRHRAKLRVYLCGNTVSKSCPYYEAFKITKQVHTMEKGDMKYFETKGGNKIAVNRSPGVYDFEKKTYSKESDKFFDWGEGDGDSDMITKGDWDIELFEHAPFPIESDMVLEKFYVATNEYTIDGGLLTLQGNVVLTGDNLFIYVHQKFGELYDEDNRMIYSLEVSPRINHEVSILKGGRNKISKKIAQLFKVNQVYVQNNEIGQALENYIKTSESYSNFKIS